MESKKIAVIPGDGIGPEITEGVVRLVREMLPGLEWEFLDHEDAYGEKSDAFWNSVRSSQAILKGPTTTPQGSGRKSLNVMMRTSLGLFANVRPVRSLSPFVPGTPGVDMVVVRENEEDLYIGSEYRQSVEQAHAIKIATRHATERISAYAMELAKAQGRSKVTCMTKDNIMKITDGMFARSFREVCVNFPEISTDHKIIDIGAALIATRPSDFGVIVTTNLYGDIISDIAAQVAGSVGLAGSANIGESLAMFEAIHGSAPDIAGKNLANPSGILAATVMMLSYLGFPEQSAILESAWLKTLEEGVATADICPPNRVPVGTEQFLDEVRRRLGAAPSSLRLSSPFPRVPLFRPTPRPSEEIRLAGVDVFIRSSSRDQGEEGRLIQVSSLDDLRLDSICNRGVKIIPESKKTPWMSDQWRYRFVPSSPEENLTQGQVWSVVSSLVASGKDVIRVETLWRDSNGPMFSS